MKQNTYGAETFLIVLLFMFLLAVFTLFRVLPLGQPSFIKHETPVIQVAPVPQSSE